MPNGPFEKLFKAMRLLGREEVLPTSRPDAEGWSGAITLVRDNLSTFANIRGGRLRSSSFVIKSRSARLADDKALRMFVLDVQLFIFTITDQSVL
jgi:Ca2+-transporting ATPase